MIFSKEGRKEPFSKEESIIPAPRGQESCFFHGADAFSTNSKTLRPGICPCGSGNKLSSPPFETSPFSFLFFILVMHGTCDCNFLSRFGLGLFLGVPAAENRLRLNLSQAILHIKWFPFFFPVGGPVFHSATRPLGVHIFQLSWPSSSPSLWQGTLRHSPGPFSSSFAVEDLRGS